jgi:hypothetical protein
MTRKRIVQGVASVAAVAALAAGGVALTSGSGNSTAATSGNAASPTNGMGAPSGSPPAGAQMGTPVTGTAATKATAAALAKYSGTVERVLKDPNGGYVVHVTKSDGTEVHVLVSAAFEVTGVQTGGPPAANGQTPPSGSSTSGTTTA